MSEGEREVGGATQSDENLLAAKAAGEPAPAGRTPWQLAGARLRRNRVALTFGALFCVILAFSLAAPLWARYVAHTGPNKNHLTDKIEVGGKQVFVVSPDGVPIGPTWRGRFFLGADGNGRDVMVRLLYGGRTSLYIGIVSAIICLLASVALGTLMGFRGGWIDTILSRFFDVMWAFPVILLGIALGTALALGGLKIGPLELQSDSLWIPIAIIAFVYIPYMARPIRGQVLSLREKEFVEAAEAVGAGPARIMVSELLPNLASTILVFFALIIANNILLEAALSFLGAGVQPPEPSWGNLIADGLDRIVTAPHLTIVPGLAIVLTVLSLNIFSDGLRDALDPRAKIRIDV